MSITTFIHSDRAEARVSDFWSRYIGCMSVIGGVMWLTFNLINAQATLTSWTFDLAALPVLLIGGAAFLLRATADQRLAFDRTTRTVRCSSQFRTRVRDLSGVEGLFLKQPALRGWISRYWRSASSLSEHTDEFNPDEMLLLIFVTDVFNDALLDWWLDQPPTLPLIQP